jgi:Predicted membrane protein (DUF2306)
MKDKNRNRWIWIIVILLATIAIAESIRRTLIIENIIPGFSPPKYPGFDAGFSKYRKLTLLHMIPGVAFMILGPLLFAKKIQEQPQLFKWIRSIFFISAYIVGISAIIVSYTVSIGGANETAAATLYGLFFLYSLTRSLIHISKDEFALYREWLLRAFAIGLAIATVRPIVGLFFALSSLSPHEFFGIAFWLGFTIHLIFAEAWIRHTRPNSTT